MRGCGVFNRAVFLECWGSQRAFVNSLATSPLTLVLATVGVPACPPYPDGVPQPAFCRVSVNARRRWTKGSNQYSHFVS